MAQLRLTAIFSKRPAPGRVKTRLCPPLAPAQAAALAEAMLRDVVQRCTTADAFATTLVFAPAAERAWFAAHFAELAATDGGLRPQHGAGLAERLATCFTEVLGTGEATSVVAIGSDQPLVTSATIAVAHAKLEGGADLVLGPDAGGGYYLVGMRRPHPELFTEVRMSTGGMYAETIALAEGKGLRVEQLQPGYDVDVAADLERVRVELAAITDTDPAFPHHTATCLDALFPIHP